MKQKIIRVLAAVVDTRNLTLYKEDGEAIIIPQGDPRLRKIVEEAAPQLVRQGWADVNITQHEDPSYADFEKEGSGAVRFFRIAKSKLKQLFVNELPPVVDTSPVPPLSIGPVPVSATPTALPDVQPATPAPAIMSSEQLDMMQKDADMVSDTLMVPREVLSVISPSTTGLQQDLVVVADPVPTASPVSVADMDAVWDGPVDEVIQHEPSEPAVIQTMSVIDEILKHAVPVSSPDFHEDTVAKQGNVVEENSVTNKDHGDNSQPDTIIAVVDGKIIPGMERIKTQFSRAAKLGSTAGVEAFLKRLAATIEKRSHSVDDLLKFLERADLPIADDGSILIYKILRKSGDKYVDCHTRKVEQFVGAYVCMDPSLVDHNRNNECSNGLHVARRGYLRGFSGDVCVLAKLDSEDVITIPTYDANKMRVCGYHIIAELSEAQYKRLRENLPITNTEDGQKLLAQMMAGNHVRRTHEVRITGSMGNGVKTTAIPERKVTMADISASVISAAAEATEIFDEDELERYADQLRLNDIKPALDKAVALSNPDGPQSDAPTDPLDVVNTVAKVTEEVRLTRGQQAQELYKAWQKATVGGGKAVAFERLLSFKKASKKSWDVLGIPDPTAKVKVNVKAALAPKPNTTPKLFDEAKEIKQKPAHANVSAKLDKGLPVPRKTPAMPKVKAPKIETRAEKINAMDIDAPIQSDEGGSPKQRIAKLLAIGLDSPNIRGSILAIKKHAKKSWEVLGVSEDQVAKILKQNDKP